MCRIASTHNNDGKENYCRKFCSMTLLPSISVVIFFCGMSLLDQTLFWNEQT